jgi:hypothetical protein
VSKQYFAATGRLIPGKTMARQWGKKVTESKDKKSKAKKSSRQTGGGTSEAPNLDPESARVLSVSQAEVEFNCQGKK